MKNVYFLSDAHLGSLAIEHGRTKERKLANFLDSIKHRAQAVYLMGDLFDFWHEYRYVVPKGYTRLLGKISELTDAGVEVHYFCGNHDLWQHDYFERECGMVLHRHNEVVEIGDKTFFLGHGDGLNRQERGFKLLRALFHNRLCQTLFAAVHPSAHSSSTAVRSSRGSAASIRKKSSLSVRPFRKSGTSGLDSRIG